jgi:hypothetical protein
MAENVTVKDYTPETKVLTQFGKPTLLARWRVALPCGCEVWIGIRADNQEAATGTIACGGAHWPLVDRFNQSLHASCLVPTDRPLVDVVAQLLGDAYTWWER